MSSSTIFGICLLPLIPVRKEDREQSEMVTQLLFGETCEVLQENDKWIYIKCLYDEYFGWIDKKMITQIMVNEIDNLSNEKTFTINKITTITHQNTSFFILPGSSIPNIIAKEKLFTIAEKSFSIDYNHQIISIIEASKYFLTAPYQWGGRSLFGIDCSGFVQIVFKIMGVKLPRDAYQQVNIGTTIDFINESKTGDLAFFDNADGLITHVGILLGNNKIIHASGRVRIDGIDHQGIFDIDQKKYSHKLRIIKRIID